MQENWVISADMVRDIVSDKNDPLTLEGRMNLEKLTNRVFHASDVIEDVVTLIRKKTSKVAQLKPEVTATRDIDIQQLYANQSPKAYWRNRRLKLSSILKYYKRGRLLLGQLLNLDYQLSINICIWSFALTDLEFKEFIYSSKIFDSRNDFVIFAEDLSTYVKPFGPESRTKRLCGELHALAGYKHEDESWDLEAEMLALATVDPPRNEGWTSLWAEAADSVFVKPSKLPRYVSFEEYTKSLKWATAGASSVGRVYYKDDNGKIMHFKPRKNMVTTLFTPDQLWSIVLKWDGTIVNTPVVKNELGKIRLAVASNLESYIYEAYCLAMFGHSFKNWGGITLDESVKEELHRNERDIAQLKKGYYALPWDFAKFDHQVRMEEIQDILTRLCDMSDPRTLPIWQKVIKSYENAILYNPQTNYKTVVKHGLQSGQRITSLIGNIWNAVVTQIVITKCNTFLPDKLDYTLGIRGDDTYILAKQPSHLYLIRLIFASLQIVGHDKKFSIRPWSFEFLRNTTHIDGVVGWPCRAIPAITERKPWSDDLLQPHLEVVTIAENIRNYERRLNSQVIELHLANKIQWSRFVGQSYLWLSLPKRMGGLGVYEFSGFIPTGKLSLTPSYEPTVDSNFSTFSPEYLGLTADESKLYNKARFVQMIRPSDIRGGVNYIMASFKEKIQSMRKQAIKWKKDLSTLVSMPPTYKYLHPEDMYYDLPRVNLTSSTPKWPRFNEMLSDYSAYVKAVAKPKSIMQIAEQHYPNVHAWLKRYQSYGWHRSDAIDMVLGSCPSELMWPLNSKVKMLALAMSAADPSIPPKQYRTRSTIGKYIYALSRSVVHAFTNSNLAKYFQY